MGQYQEAVSRSQGLRGGCKAAANVKHAGGFSWESRQKYSPLTADYDGYSSEASADDGWFCICESSVFRLLFLIVTNIWIILPSASKKYSYTVHQKLLSN